MSQTRPEDRPKRPDTERAFDGMVRTHYGALCDFVDRFVGTRAVAEDIVQDIFVRIWQRADRFDYEDPLPYLYQAARNRAASHRRHERTRERADPRIVDALPTAPRPDTDLEYRTLEEEITRAVDMLPPRCREIYTMNRQQGHSYAEIARILGISVKTVEVQMWRALKTLRARLSPLLSMTGVLVASSEMASRFLR